MVAAAEVGKVEVAHHGRRRDVVAVVDEKRRIHPSVLQGCFEWFVVL